jgi:hypothetical protein
MLEKLEITGYSDESYSDSKRVTYTLNPIVVMINPKSYSQKLGILYTKQKGAGATGKARAFNRDQGETFELALVLDGTGTVPDATSKSVDRQLADLRRLIYDVNGDIHSPNYVKLSWGTLTFKGRLKSLDIDYGLFAPDGTPLRANVKANFIGFHDNTDGRKGQNLSSPDLTHAVFVEAGQTLPLLCHQIYRDSRYYLAVAAHNGLDDFRALEPGTMLLFPPLAGPAS